METVGSFLLCWKPQPQPFTPLKKWIDLAGARHGMLTEVGSFDDALLREH
jgi:hypothetical protein